MTQNSNTAKYSLVRTTESSSNDNIPQNNGVVNNNSMQKSSDDAEKTKYNSVCEKAEDVFKDSVSRDSNMT